LIVRPTDDARASDYSWTRLQPIAMISSEINLRL
jgi:hypothetical protein